MSGGRVWDLLDSDQYNDNYETEAEREPECLHISYTEQAGGFAICDECGEDVTREAIRRRR